jgi:hypothetical protein
MSLSTISIPVSTKQFLDLVAHLKMQNSDRDPVEAIHAAIEYWISSNSHDLPSSQVKIHDTEKDGYWWKSVFLPTGTKLKLIYRGKRYSAEVTANGVIFDGKTMSPSNFVVQATGTTRNAWRDIDVLFPESQAWVLADKLRVLSRDSSDIV